MTETGRQEFGVAAGVGDRAPVRIVDVARLAGVSIGTASKALNGAGQLRQETRDRVRDAADRLGFVADHRARALSTGRSYTVGLITTDSFGRFSIPVLLGAEDVLGAGELALVLCDTRDDPVRERHYLRSLAARHVDGVIVTGRSSESRPPVDATIPAVYAFTPSTDPSDVSLVVDDEEGARMLARHLLDLGRRRVAYVSGPEHHDAARRRAAAAAEVFGDALVGAPVYGSWSEEWGRAAVDLLARTHPDTDAIACASDQIARGVVDRLREVGRSVPGEVAVTGFDDWDVMARAARPPLTTVDLRLEELGRLAGAALLDLVAGRTPEGPRTVRPTLIIRGSTAGA